MLRIERSGQLLYIHQIPKFRPPFEGGGAFFAFSEEEKLRLGH